MNPNFTYPFWFQRGNDNGIDFWVFTFSGDEDDPKNFDVPELKLLFDKIDFGQKEFTDSIIGIGIDWTGSADFHFIDESVSVSTAFLNLSHEFMELVNLVCLGYLKMIQNHDERIRDWFVKYEEYHKK